MESKLILHPYIHKIKYIEDYPESVSDIEVLVDVPRETLLSFPYQSIAKLSTSLE